MTTFSGWPLAVSSRFVTLKKAIGASERVWKIIDTPSPQIGGQLVPATLDGHIQVNNVSFSYPSRPNDLILENVSLDIKPESTCAIVGKSGSGKSTLAKILFNFYPIQGGSIALDGNIWTELDYDWLRSNMAMVPQDPELFADTIR